MDWLLPTGPFAGSLRGMRTIVNSTYITLDGVIQDPQDWPSLEGEDPRGYEIQRDLLLSSDALIMGRHTYDGFAPVWSGRSGDEYSDHINTMPKYVASSTLRDPAWPNTTVIEADPVAAIRELKEQDGGTILQYGVGPLTFGLMEEGLLDELRLWIHPFVLGKGGAESLLYRDTVTTRFQVADVTTLNHGIVIVSYRLAA
jgi:dihydrofolate reductase